MTPSNAVPLLVPDMPSPEALLPWLEQMHAARYYSNFGPLVQRLEAEFAMQFAVPTGQVTTVASATLGLELVLQALNLPPGSQVLVPALTFVATATAIVRAGHIPVLADVDSRTWTLTPEIAQRILKTTQVQAVMPVSTFGLPHDMSAWQAFEESTGLPVIVDAAAGYGNQWLHGARGTLVFSLHATKSLPAGEGGFVVSTRPGLAAKVRQLSNFGINLDHAGKMPVGTLASIGTNAKMSEFHAAVTLAALQHWDRHAQQRRDLLALMRTELDAIAPGRLRWQEPGEAGRIQAPTLLCVRLPGARKRDALERLCAQSGIGTRRWYQPLLNGMGVLASRCVALDAPQAQALGKDLIGLPFFREMQPQQRQRVMDAVRAVMAEGS